MPILQGYTADYCDPPSKITLVRQVGDAGFVRLAAQLAGDHYEKCAKYSDFLELDYAYNEQLGEYSKALEIINRLIEYDPASASYRFSRGKVFDDTKRYEKALVDYVSTLDLLGRPEKIDVDQFYEIATMYAELGKFCEAATPLETYISYDFVKRKTPQLDRLINEYRSKGNCKQSTSSDSASVRVRKSRALLLVEATLNNVVGLFILDTGASMVTVTKSFADKAKISGDMDDKVTLQTANGLSEGLLATFVPVVVVDDAKLGADDNVVGLLGMSVLSRFVVNVSKDTIELHSRF
jgi:aspartyl protease family protein